MARPQKEPLRPLTGEERRVLEQVARARSEPALSLTSALAATRMGMSRSASFHGVRNPDTLALIPEIEDPQN